MKIRFLILSVLFFSITYGYAQQQASAGAISFLKRFRSDYTKSVLEAKPETLSPYYVEDVRLMPEFQKTIVGKSKVMLYRNAFTTRFNILAYERKELEILDLGTMILEVGSFNSKVKLKSTDKDYDLNGKYFNVWEKSANEKLVLISEAWNYNHQVDIGDQLHFSDVPAYDVAVDRHLPVNSHITFELAALNALMETTISQHDAAIWSQFYTDDGMFCYTGNPIYQGKAVMGKFIEEHCKHLGVFEKLNIRNDRIDHLGKYVIEYASHVAIWRSGEYSGVGLGKDLRIWRREEDGSLKIFRQIAMYD